MEDLFRHLHMPPELACRFLAIFSRMEYALKSTEFAVGTDKKVGANWDSFANTIDQQFLAITDSDVVEARKYLLTRPPRKQVLSGSKIEFSPQVIDANQTTTQQVLKMVRTVRNNLFHGGKFCPAGEAEPGRDRLLVTYGTRVLLASVVLHTDVKASFEH